MPKDLETQPNGKVLGRNSCDHRIPRPEYPGRLAKLLAALHKNAEQEHA